MKVVRYVGQSLSLGEKYLGALDEGSGYVVVDNYPVMGNVTLRAEIDGKPAQLSMDSLTRDFVDLATLIYIVDELSDRSKQADSWTRTFDVLAPVADPEVWADNALELSRMLRTLAGDNYSFSWTKRGGLSGFGKHRQFLPRTGYDAVTLFSGGIDSFLGAYKLLNDGKRILLVGHQADGTAASAQTELAEILRKQFPGKLRLVQFRVARSFAPESRFDLPEKCEETHRPRSLLFLALAIMVAKTAKVSSVYIPENGLIALNPPLSKSRLGTLTTRTAHPKYLTELADFLGQSSIFTGRILNPFLFESKTEMLAELPQNLRTAVSRSVSCARPSRYKNLGVRHCGYCVPCIYRRIAMVEADLDNSNDYAFDVVKNLPAIVVSKQLDFRALVAFAKRILNASQLEKDLIVYAHGHFPTTAAERFTGIKVSSTRIWSEMLDRWANDFLSKLRVLAPRATRRIVGL